MIAGNIGLYVWVFCIEQFNPKTREVKIKFIYLNPQEGSEYGSIQCEGLLNVESLLRHYSDFYKKGMGHYACTLLAYFYKKDWYKNFDLEKTPEMLLEMRRDRITNLRATRTSGSLDSDTHILESPEFTVKQTNQIIKINPRRDKP